ncbi:MAG: dienelactone hydrolase family protein [Candidatus Dormibacteraeota bacterium]|nr:dienelactone hydrolase family protein [Candidatus Dormibacteraeota bacterium]MBV9526471.1 dienelactone hydrolase family protein [Candidatus Dormibacteraeota bacterium]
MGEMIEFPSNGHTCAGYLALPQSGRGPGVVVIQEWWGLVGHVKDVCERFAGEGFVALAPDLYHGKSASLKEPDTAGKLLMEMELDGAARDMLGAARWLAADERVAGDRVGIIGFCMGGALALYAASLADVFGAVVTYYPYLARTEAARPDFSRIKGAVQGHVGDQDHAYTREQIEAVEEQIRGGGADVEFHWYPGADHAFFNDDRPEVHRPDQAQQAWDRTLAFLRKHLAQTAAPV